jgi:hypothetical protein
MGLPTISRMAAVMLLVGTTLAAQAPDDAAQAAAQAAAEAWLKIVDAGNYGSSWDEAASMFKSGVPKEGWTAAVAKARSPQGGLTSRTLVSRNATVTLPGAPAGSYVVVRYAAVFENSPRMAETVILVLDAERGWRVVGYTVTAA